MYMGVALNWLANFVVAFAFPVLQGALGPAAFALFALSTAGFGAFTYWIVPETRFKTTAELHTEIVNRCQGCAAAIGAL